MSVLWRGPPPFPESELNAGMRRIPLDVSGNICDPGAAVFWLDWEYAPDPVPADLLLLISTDENTAGGF